MKRASAWKSAGWISTGRAVVLTSALPMDTRSKFYRTDVNLSCCWSGLSAIPGGTGDAIVKTGLAAQINGNL